MILRLGRSTSLKQDPVAQAIDADCVSLMDPVHASHLIDCGTRAVLVSREWLDSNQDWSTLQPVSAECARLGVPMMATISAGDQGIGVARILDHGFDEVLSESMTTHEILGRFRHASEVTQHRMTMSRDLGIDPESGVWTRIVAIGCLTASHAFAARNSEPLSVSLFRIRVDDGCTPRRRSQAINRLASSLRSLLRTEDLIFRIRPDCFLVIWTRTPQNLAKAAMQRAYTSLRSCQGQNNDITIEATSTDQLDAASDPIEALARLEALLPQDASLSDKNQAAT